jgi:hypothetical protein
MTIHFSACGLVAILKFLKVSIKSLFSIKQECVMCITRFFLGILTASLVFAIPVFGQVKKGLNEVNVAGAINVASAGGESFTVITLAGTAAHFVSNNISVGGSLAFVKAEGIDAVGNFAGLVSMHFASRATVTATTSTIRLFSVDSPGSSFSWRVEVAPFPFSRFTPEKTLKVAGSTTMVL